MQRCFTYSAGFLFFLLPYLFKGQGSGPVIEGGENKKVIYHTDHTGQIYVHTRGYGAIYRYTKHVTVQKRNYFEADFSILKHPKEMKVVGDAFERKRFVYGKLNNILALKASVGSQHVFYHKADLEAVEVRYSYSIGTGLAFLKPYYVQVNRLRDNNIVTDEVPFNEATFTMDSVSGRASFFTGFDHMQIRPIISAKFNISFEYAHYSNIVRALETGICLDYYPMAVPIMARNADENLVLTIRLGFVFGRKFY